MNLTKAVLVNVDDHEPARYARAKVLEREGFTVHSAASGAEALRLVKEAKPDLVLLDVHLPDISGIEVLRQVKASGAAVIVLQISASAISAPHATEALNTGADGYLMEPVDPDVLVATVKAFLRLHAAERSVATANQELARKNVELEKLNRALTRSNDDLEHFAYVASHDLQEPLRTISTHLELLSRISAGRFSEGEREIFGFAMEGARRMSSLIHGVLEYSRTAKEVPALRPTPLAGAVRWAMENLAESIAASEAELSVGELPVVRGDEVQLGQVFQNLIGNSLKYRSPGTRPRISVSAEAGEEGTWQVELRDNGVGVPAEYADEVFRPFKRLHGYDIPGTGIGLSLCRRIIEAHGGKIWVRPLREGGSAFCFTVMAVEGNEAGSSG